MKLAERFLEISYTLSTESPLFIYFLIPWQSTHRSVSRDWPDSICVNHPSINHIFSLCLVNLHFIQVVVTLLGRKSVSFLNAKAGIMPFTSDTSLVVLALKKKKKDIFSDIYILNDVNSQNKLKPLTSLHFFEIIYFYSLICFICQSTILSS